MRKESLKNLTMEEKDEIIIKMSKQIRSLEDYVNSISKIKRIKDTKTGISKNVNSAQKFLSNLTISGKTEKKYNFFINNNFNYFPHYTTGNEHTENLLHNNSDKNLINSMKTTNISSYGNDFLMRKTASQNSLVTNIVTKKLYEDSSKKIKTNIISSLSNKLSQRDLKKKINHTNNIKMDKDNENFSKIDFSNNKDKVHTKTISKIEDLNRYSGESINDLKHKLLSIRDKFSNVLSQYSNICSSLKNNIL